jgi:hypothetical protein
MKKLALVAQIRRKKWSLKFQLWKHRVSYAIYQKPDMALFWFCMAGLFVVQVMLFVGR